MSDPGNDLPLSIADHVLRRYALPLGLLAASVLRYNVFSLTYLILFLLGVVITGPRQRSSRVGCILYVAIVLVLSVIYALSQAFFQISLATGPTLDYCETLEVILREVGLIQFTAPAIDIFRYMSVDILVALIASVSFGVSIKVATLHNRKMEEDSAAIVSVESNNDEEDHEDKFPSSPSPTEMSTLSVPSSSSSNSLPQSYYKLPQWVMTVLNVLVFFLFWLAGVATPSIVSFWYFFVFLTLAIMWSTHFKHAQCVGRVLRLVSLVYAAVHILALYLYQFQSFQLSAPATSFDSTKDLVVRLFGLLPVIETSCQSPTTLSVWDNTPTSYIVNPWALLALYWTLGTDSQLWLTTPNSLWSTFNTYCIPKITSPSDSLRVAKRGYSIVQHYGATDSNTKISTLSGGEEGGKSVEETGGSSTIDGGSSSQFLELEDSTHSKPYLTLLGIKQKLVYQAVELWNRVMSISYVFSLVVMMVWSVLYPSWPALVLLLWAVVIWVIPRVNPKQSLQYSSPFLVVYSVGLLLLAYVNALPVTRHGFTWQFKVGIECKFTPEEETEDCLNSSLGSKCLLSLVFFASLHQLIKEIQERRKKHTGDTQMLARNQNNSEGVDSDGSSAVNKLYNEILHAMTTYWIIIVLASFLLVILVGQPSAFKTVYLISLFVFFLIYQLFQKWWIYISYPLWWLLVLYAALHLIAVYTFQFDEIRDLWYKAYNNHSFSDAFTPEELYVSIGFQSRDKNDARRLFELLVPLAIFIAVVALQVRYFTPYKTTPREETPQDRITVGQVLTGITRAVALTEIEFGVIEKDIERKEEERQRRRKRSKSGNTVSLEEDEVDLGTLPQNKEKIEDNWEVTGSRETTPTDPASSTLTFYRFLVYSLIKIRQFIILAWHLFWRFFEIHTSKLVIIATFAFGLYEPSVTYFFVIVVCIVILAPLPLPVLYYFFYPILTVYLGFLSVGKYAFQFPLVPIRNFRNECNISSSVEDIPGKVFEYMFSPQSSDPSWIGLSKTNDTSTYIGGIIAVGLLICFWYVSRRHQAHYYSSNEIVVKSWESRSLFLELDYSEVHTSAVCSIKFLINHWFDMYGVEMCFIFEAMLIAARIDVYGIIYTVILGLMLVTPRTLLAPVWLLFLVLHGVILISEYALLVGLPPSLICHINGYPWDNIFTGSYGVLEKWLFLPHANESTLDKYLLYADLFAYVLICLQLRSFISNPLTILNKTDKLSPPPDVYKTKYWFDNIKIFIFQYSFWMSLFILFAAAATRISLVGLVYLILCFVFLYRGQNLLTDVRKIRIRWWSVLRLFIWLVFLVRIILQFVGCVFGNSGIFNEPSRNTCILVSVFNIRCVRDGYYGIKSDNRCDNGSENSTGLWLEVLAFTFVTLQMLILDTTYAEQVRDKVIKKERDAENFAKVKNQLTKEKREEAERLEEEELVELKQRAQKLNLSERKIDHFLYAGVRVPDDYMESVTCEVTPESKSPRKQLSPPLEITEKESSSLGATDDDDDVKVKERKDDGIFDDEETRTQDSKTTEKTQLEIEKSFVSKGIQFVYSLWLTVVDGVIEWLEKNGDDYRLVISRIKQGGQSESSKDALLETEGEKSLGGEDIKKQLRSIPEDDDPHVKAKPVTGEKSMSIEKESRAPKPRSSHFDYAGDTLIDVLQTTEVEEQRAHEIESKFEMFTKKHAERPRRFLTALYYWSISHFEYVVFFFVIVTIVNIGSLPSFVYAVLLFLWGLLSLPIPTKRFWLALIFYTMMVMFIKYIFSFFLLSVVNGRVNNALTGGPWLGVNSHNILAWCLGVRPNENYFQNAVVNLLLLMVLMFQRGLLKQYGLWTNAHFIHAGSNFFEDFYKTIKHFFKQVIESTSVAGRKDYYVTMLTFDILCFLPIIFGYSSFSVTTTTSSEITDVANYIQSDNIPLPFLIMLMLHFLSIVVDRAIYIRHSVIGKLIFYIFLLIAWHVGLLIVVPIVTHNPFYNNIAAQMLYLFKCGYFVVSALQIISGYPTRLLGYFVGSSYSTVSGLIFQGYRLIPIIPELREVIDWVFTDTSLSIIHWLRVQELWAQIYQVKVRRMRELSNPRDLGDGQSLISKALVGGGFVVALILLIWGPLILISLINQTSKPNPPISATVSLSLEGSQLLEIQAQNPFIFRLTDGQYRDLRNKVNSASVSSDFLTLFPRDNFRHILFPGNSSTIWTASPTTKQQLKLILEPKKNATLTFSWSIMRSVQGIGDETVTGSYSRYINQEIIQQFIKNLDSSNPVEDNNITLNDLYPVLLYSPNTGESREFTELSQFIEQSKFDGVASLSINDAYTLREPNCTIDNNNTRRTIITEWWTLRPGENFSHFLTPQGTGEDIVNPLELVIYSQPVSPQIFSFVASIGVIGLYLSVVLVIGRFIRAYISALPQNLLIDQIANPNPLLKLCDDIFFVREMKNLVLEEILVGKLYYIFRSPERLISLTEDTHLKEKID